MRAFSAKNIFLNYFCNIELKIAINSKKSLDILDFLKEKKWN